MYSRQMLCVSKIFFQAILQNSNIIFTVILGSDSLLNRNYAKQIMKIKFAAGKIGRTRVVGAKKVLKDFKKLTRTLQDLMRKHGSSDTKSLQKACKSIRTSITPEG